jgi:hypothetical protein
MDAWYNAPLIGVVVGAVLGFVFSFLPAWIRRRKHQRALLQILKTELREMLAYRRTKVAELTKYVESDCDAEELKNLRFNRERDADISFLRNAHSYNFLTEQDLTDLTRIFHRMGHVNGALNMLASESSHLSADESKVFIDALRRIRDDTQELAAWIEALVQAHGVKPYILHLTKPVPGPKIIRSHVPLDVRGVISRWTYYVVVDSSTALLCVLFKKAEGRRV